MKPRLLIIINRFVIGGHIFDTIPLAYYLQNDLEILIVFGKKKEDEINAFFLLDKYPGLHIQELPSLKRSVNPFIDLQAYFEIGRVIKKFKPHIIHTHGAKPGLLGRIAGYRHSTPVVIHTFHGHFFHSYYSPLLSNVIILLERFLGKFSTKIIATSKQQWEDLVIKYKIAAPRKVQIIYLGIEESVLLNDKRSLRKSFRTTYNLNEEVAIGIIARIAKVKNFTLFTEVVNKVLLSTKVPVKFFAIGDGALKKDVQTELDEKNISWCEPKSFNSNCNVIFTSWIPDVFAAIPGLDIVILTSNNEGTGLSLVEAQLCGVPVVATNVGGVQDTLIDNETGYFSEPGNALEFSTKLQKLIEDKVLRERMGKAAEVFAKERFSKKVEVNSFKHLYFSLLKDKSIL